MKKTILFSLFLSLGALADQVEADVDIAQHEQAEATGLAKKVMSAFSNVEKTHAKYQKAKAELEAFKEVCQQIITNTAKPKNEKDKDSTNQDL